MSGVALRGTPSSHRHVRMAWAASLRGMRLTMRADAGARRITGALTAGQYLVEWQRFVRTELTAPPGTVRDYTLKDGAVRVALRHGSEDVVLVGEIFHHRVYAPPARGLAALHGAPVRRVLDLGANIGLFGAWARLHWPQAEIDAVEPDRHNLEVLRRCVAGNDGPRWTVHG